MRTRFVRGFGGDVADEDVVDEIGGGREEVVVGGGDDLGEDGADQQRSEDAPQGKAVDAGVGEDLAGAGRGLRRWEERGAYDGDGDDDGFEDDGADDPADDGAGGVFFGFGGEELLVHGLVAEHEQAGGKEELQAWMKVRSPRPGSGWREGRCGCR